MAGSVPAGAYVPASGAPLVFAPSGGHKSDAGDKYAVPLSGVEAAPRGGKDKEYYYEPEATVTEEYDETKYYEKPKPPAAKPAKAAPPAPDRSGDAGLRAGLRAVLAGQRPPVALVEDDFRAAGSEALELPGLMSRLLEKETHREAGVMKGHGPRFARHVDEEDEEMADAYTGDDAYTGTEGVEWTETDYDGDGGYTGDEAYEAEETGVEPDTNNEQAPEEPESATARKARGMLDWLLGRKTDDEGERMRHQAALKEAELELFHRVEERHWAEEEARILAARAEMEMTLQQQRVQTEKAQRRAAAAEEKSRLLEESMRAGVAEGVSAEALAKRMAQLAEEIDRTQAAAEAAAEAAAAKLLAEAEQKAATAAAAVERDEAKAEAKEEAKEEAAAKVEIEVQAEVAAEAVAAAPKELRRAMTMDVAVQAEEEAPPRSEQVVSPVGSHVAELAEEAEAAHEADQLLVIRIAPPAGVDAPPPAPLAEPADHELVVLNIVQVTDDLVATTSEEPDAQLWRITDGALHRTLKGHTWRPYAVAAFHGGLATGGWDKEVRMWDLNGVCKATCIGHTDKVWALVALGMSHVVSGSWDKTLRLWNVVTGRCEAVMAGHHDKVWTLAALGPARVVSGSADATARVWNAATGECERVLAGHADTISVLVVLPDNRLVTGSWDHCVKVWDSVAPGGGLPERPLDLVAHAAKVTAAVAVGEYIVTAGSDGVVCTWDKDGNGISTLEAHTRPVTALMALDAERVVSSAADNRLICWNVKTGRCERLQMAHHGLCFATFKANRAPSDLNGRWAYTLPSAEKRVLSIKLAAGCEDGTLRIRFTTSHEALLARIEAEKKQQPGCCGVAKPPPPKLALQQQITRTATAFSAAPPSATATSPSATLPPGYEAAVHVFLTLPGSGHIISTTDDASLAVWDPATGANLAVLQGHADRVWTMALAGDEKLLTASWDGTLRVWDTRTLQCVTALSGHADRIWALLALTPNTAVTGSWDHTVRVWDLKRGVCVWTLRGHTDRVWTLAALGHRRAVSGSADGTLRVWNVQSGACERLLTGHTDLVSSVVATGGGYIVSASWDCTLRLWNAVRGSCERVMTGHKAKVTSLAALGRGHVVSGSADHHIRVWDASRGLVKHIIKDHTNWVTTLLPLPRFRFASGSSDNTVRIWDCETGRCERVLATWHPEEHFALATGADVATCGKWCFAQPKSHPNIVSVTSIAV